MNCANHADASAVAYCRTCGKALCANCTRPVRGVIYCEDCLGAKMEGVPGSIPGTTTGVSAGFAPGTYVPPVAGQIPVPPPMSSGGPNPTVAGILAGFFPFGVGAVYTGQYAKGLAHLVVMTLLIAGASASDHGHGEALGVICGLGIAFFYVYQIIDAVRSAKAIQMAQPVPDPFGLAATFGGGARVETGRIPMGAVILILIGVLFLLHTMGLTEFGLDRFWPLLLIGFGGWMFARQWGLVAGRCYGCQCARCRTRKIMGPSIMLTIGVLFLLENLHVADFGRTWPVILLVIGGLKLLQGTASTEGHIQMSPAQVADEIWRSKNQYAGGPVPPVPPIPPTPPVPPVPPTGEVNRG
jgi:cell wall-active antibiotic response 4TMS protein YvqF/B-box zinc finger protein